MQHDRLSDIQKKWHGTLPAYVIGLILSLLFTGASFYLVWKRILTGYNLILSIVGLGILQAAAQLLFFLHVGQEAKPRWETVVFSFMVMVLFIVVLGTLWIMFDLNHRVMPWMWGLSTKGAAA